jgi:hypothetical protein
MKIANLIGVLLLGAIPIGMVTSCDPSRLATPDEAAALDALDGQIEAAEAQIKLSEDGIKVHLATLKALGSRAEDASTAEEAAAVQAEVLALMVELQTSTRGWEAQLESLGVLGEQATQIEGEIGSRQTDGVSGMLGMIDPKLGLAATLLGPLFIRFGAKRSRKHLSDSAKKMVKMGLGESLSSLAKAYGFSHTGEEWEDLMRRAGEAAAAQGDAGTAAAIQASRNVLLKEPT